MRYEEHRRREAKWNLGVFLALILIVNLTFVIVNHNKAVAANPKDYLCYWNLSYTSNKIIDNSQTMESGYPKIALSKETTISTAHCPEMYLIGSNREWIDPTLANNQFGDGTFTVGKELLPGKYATAVAEAKEIVCNHMTTVAILGSNLYTTKIVCAPKNLAYLTKID